MIEATLVGWSARRAGGRITITHAAGKVSNVDVIAPAGGKLIATAANGKKYELAL